MRRCLETELVLALAASLACPALSAENLLDHFAFGREVLGGAP